MTYYVFSYYRLHTQTHTHACLCEYISTYTCAHVCMSVYSLPFINCDQRYERYHDLENLNKEKRYISELTVL